jgi:nitrogen fixation NifU-like protein
MTESVKGLTPTQALALFDKVVALVTGDSTRSGAREAEDGPEMGKLEAFAGVAEYPMRVKCATLAWHTLRAALLTAASDTVTTET